MGQRQQEVAACHPVVQERRCQAWPLRYPSGYLLTCLRRLQSMGPCTQRRLGEAPGSRLARP